MTQQAVDQEMQRLNEELDHLTERVDNAGNCFFRMQENLVRYVK